MDITGTLSTILILVGGNPWTNGEPLVLSQEPFDNDTLYGFDFSRNVTLELMFYGSDTPQFLSLAILESWVNANCFFGMD